MLDAPNPHDLHSYPYRFEEQGVHTGDDIWDHMMGELKLIHGVLQSINTVLHEPFREEFDNERFVQILFKTGFGSNWIPNSRGKFYIYVYAPVATALNVTNPIGAPFILTIPAPTLPNLWNLLDLPEQCSIMLDATATSNQMNIYVLLTNRKM